MYAILVFEELSTDFSQDSGSKKALAYDGKCFFDFSVITARGARYFPWREHRILSLPSYGI